MAAGMTPGEAARFFCASCLGGGVLGLVYGFLRPLGRRRRHLADGLFCLAAGAVWGELAFGIFRGDLRLGIFLGLPLGAGLWLWGPERLTSPLWEGIWGTIWGILSTFSRCGKKVCTFFKFLLSIRQKIGYNRKQTKFAAPSPPGGIPMERKPKRKIILRPGSRGLKILCALVLVLALAALAALQYVRMDIAAMTEEKRQQAVDLEKENAELTEKQEALGSVDSVKDIAESELGYVSPDAVVIGEK